MLSLLLNYFNSIIMLEYFQVVITINDIRPRLVEEADARKIKEIFVYFKRLFYNPLSKVSFAFLKFQPRHFYSSLQTIRPSSQLGPSKMQTGPSRLRWGPSRLRTLSFKMRTESNSFYDF